MGGSLDNTMRGFMALNDLLVDSVRQIWNVIASYPILMLAFCGVFILIEVISVFSILKNSDR